MVNQVRPNPNLQPSAEVVLDQEVELVEAVAVAEPLVHHKDKLELKKEAPQTLSFGARLKQTCLNFFGWIYKAFYRNCPSFEKACEQGHLWLVRGYAFTKKLPEESLRVALGLATTAGKWKICQYFAEYLKCSVIDEYGTTPLHRVLRAVNEKNFTEITLNLIGMLPVAVLKMMNHEGYSPLWVSTKYGSLEISKALVKRDPESAHKLMFEMISNPESTAGQLETLLEAGVSPNEPNGRGETALAAAISANRTDLMQVLIQQKANVHQLSGKTQRYSLNLALDNVLMLKILRENGADLSYVDVYKQQPIHYAAMAGNQEALEFFIKYGIDVNTVETENNMTPLHIAMLSKAEGVARFLLEKGAANALSNQGISPLLLAYANDLPFDICHSLIKLGQNLDAKDDSGKTVFDYAREKRDLIGLDLLAQKGVDFSAIPDNEADAIVLEAYQNGLLEIVYQMVKLGKGVNAHNDLGMSLLQMAAKDGHTDLCNLLLDKGASLTEKTDYNGVMFAGTAFELAMKQGNLDIAMNIAAKGGVARMSDLNFLDNEQFSSYVVAALAKGIYKDSGTPLKFLNEGLRREDFELVQQIINCNYIADPADIPLAALFHLSDKEFNVFMTKAMGFPSLDPQKYLNEAVRRKDILTLQVLIRKGADPAVPDENQKTAFHFAAQYAGGGKILQALINLHIKKRGGDVSSIFAKNKNGNTPLHLAAATGFDKNIGVLLGTSEGLKHINEPNADGNTPLHLAAAKEHENVCTLLLQHGADKTLKNLKGAAPQLGNAAVAFAKDLVKDFFHRN